jgi:hypothetical protein
VSQEKQPSEGTVNEDAQVIRRKDLSDLADTFKGALSPVLELVGLVGDQNILVKETNKRVTDTNHKQKWQSIWLIALTAGFIAVAIAQTRTSSDQDETAKGQQELVKGGVQVQKDLAEVTKDLRELVEHARKTREDVADIKEDQADDPEVQLVAETDPIKARRAPVKVRITPRKPSKRPGSARPSPPPTTSAVELPIPRKALK